MHKYTFEVSSKTLGPYNLTIQAHNWEDAKKQMDKTLLSTATPPETTKTSVCLTSIEFTTTQK